ncbi:MAG: SUF system NifU family Fe-S cluster assembly protein [Candidatus Dojkabacteria bacterium]|nr:SUF system NifU family Fe-S cluster assembly protein [Candidatus Dojkabacteria bacterium]
MDLYRQHILEHYKSPKNFGTIKSRAKSSHGENPSCGDSISIDVIFENDRIKDIKFQGEGCAISIAAASLLTEKVKGMTITEVAGFELADMQEILGIEITPARKRCALLPLNVLKKIILQELKSN